MVHHLSTARLTWQAAGSHHGYVVVIVDSVEYRHAKMHRSWRDARQGRLHLYVLPPYSPELNTIKRMWKLMRRECLHNRRFTLFGSRDRIRRAIAQHMEQSEECAQATLRS